MRWRIRRIVNGCAAQQLVARLDGTYDKYLLGGGEYPLKIFIGRKC
jgi:hypothetical protein